MGMLGAKSIGKNQKMNEIRTKCKPIIAFSRDIC